MANNGILGDLPDEAFNPLLELGNRPKTLVWLGVFFASTSVVAALSSPPNFILFGNKFDPCVFYMISLFVLFFFGIGLIVLGWIAADNETGDYNVASRTALRAAQIVLVVAIGLYEVNSKS